MVKPETVLSPQTRVEGPVSVLANTGPDGYSIAELVYDGAEAVGMRWNGGGGDDLGHPTSRGQPTWFILPEPVANLVRASIRLGKNSEST